MSEEHKPPEQVETLSTLRLLLRPWRASDGTELGALAERSAGRRDGSAGRENEELADARGWIARARVSDGAAAFVVTLRGQGGEADTIIGAGALAHSPDQLTRREVGIWIGEPFAGKGFATEALHALIDFGFAAEATQQLWGVCRVTNGRARRVIEKCGFQFRESGMARSVVLRGAVAVERFVLERRNWASLKAWGADGSGRKAAGVAA